MGLITWSDIKAITDSVGVQVDRLKAALGTGTTDTTVAKGARTNLGRVQTIAGSDAQAGADLLQGFIDAEDAVTAGSAKSYPLFQDSISTIENHVRNRAVAPDNTLDRQATVAVERYSPSFAEVYRALRGATALSPANVYSPVITMATFEFTGEAEGTTTDGSAIDITLYGPADIEAEATSTVTSSEITATVVNEDGDEVPATGTLAGTSGTKVNLTTSGSKKVVDVLSIAVTGGANGQTFRIQSKPDRTPAE